MATLGWQVVFFVVLGLFGSYFFVFFVVFEELKTRKNSSRGMRPEPENDPQLSCILIFLETLLAYVSD